MSDSEKRAPTPIQNRPLLICVECKQKPVNHDVPVHQDQGTGMGTCDGCGEHKLCWTVNGRKPGQDGVTFLPPSGLKVGDPIRAMRKYQREQGQAE